MQRFGFMYWTYEDLKLKNTHYVTVLLQDHYFYPSLFSIHLSTSAGFKQYKSAL